MGLLRRYWFAFKAFPHPTALNLGCGVTAYSYEDALHLLRERVFPASDLPEIVDFKVDVDVTRLDSNHVVPNLGLVVDRGVWFPQGYAERVD
jgi:hypothetical protein